MFLKTLNTVNQPKSIVPDVQARKSQLSSSLAVWLTPKQYLCEECGYLGIVVMELEKEESETENKKEKMP